MALKEEIKTIYEEYIEKMEKAQADSGLFEFFLSPKDKLEVLEGAIQLVIAKRVFRNPNK
jgi:hypothetical protein